MITTFEDFAADLDSAMQSSRIAIDTTETSPFKRDCLWIVEHAQASADHFPGIAALVLLSIRQPFVFMPRQVASVAEKNYESPYLFGWKPDGLRYVRANKKALHAAAVATYTGKRTLDDLILEYLAIPGMGIVKASFLAQMTVGDGACLDTLNLRTLGLSETAFRLSKKLTVKTVKARIAAYNACWRTVGDSEYWWNSWCEFVAQRTHNDRGASMPGFESCAAVSGQHRLAITGGIK